MSDPSTLATEVWQKVQSAAATTESATAAIATSAVQHASTSTDFNAQFLASALRVGGDAQYFEESISPSTVRSELSTADPSNPTHTTTMVRGMKWLLASLSKGRDVSDFFSHVVKLVEAKSLEVRKMVYVYLVRYADHDTTCRELSLLSINSFQRGLAAPEPLIRALALRVLSSIRVPDVLQIQIMGVQKCSKDNSPYVRKCAANALAKLCPRCDVQQRESIMLETITTMLDEDSSTMVLTSAIIAFAELCPDRLELLHGSYRKLCHLLTDMDEWGQVVAMDVLSRYCRAFFREPRGAKMGSAAIIDRERRIRRTSAGGVVKQGLGVDSVGDALDELLPMEDGDKKKNKKEKSVPVGRGSVGPTKIKRRVVKKAFYSDEEDESEEEEVYASNPLGAALPVAGAMRQRSVMGFSDNATGGGGGMGHGENPAMGGGAAGGGDDEDEDLHEDHKLLLRSSLPLLMSRNAAVVLAVCSLHYYCGVASIKIRSAIGKSLVRIHRDRREIQYVVLTSIRSLVSECPSAFTPFLDDFFVKAMDPSFTRMIKLNILVDLSLEPASIKAVLKELRSYVRHDDKEFVCASIRTVGRVAELARIVYDRHGAKAALDGGGDRALEDARREANEIALNCLYGLMVLTECRQDEKIVGECVTVMQRIISQLLSGSELGSGSEMIQSSKTVAVEDPNSVQSMALRRLVLQVVRSISSVTKGSEEEDGADEEGVEEENNNGLGEKEKRSIVLPPTAVGPALWIVGEWLTNSNSSIPIFHTDEDNKSHMRSELLRLLARSFPDLSPSVKVQAVHFACKTLIASKEGHVSSKKRAADDVALCEHVLAMGRIDVHQDVRDRSRFESHVLHSSVGLTVDIDSLPAPPNNLKKMTIPQVKAMLLHQKPPPSYLPIDEDEGIAGNKKENNPFRFGTLSSLVSHRAGQAYRPLPPWAEKDSPSSLRDPPAPEQQEQKSDGDGWNVSKTKGSSFYDSDEEASTSEESSSDESSSEEESSSSSGSEGDDEDSTSSEEESSEEEESGSSDEESDDEESDASSEKGTVGNVAILNGGGTPFPAQQKAESSEDESSDEEGSSDESSEDDEASTASEPDRNEPPPAAVGSLIPLGVSSNTRPPPVKHESSHMSENSSIAEGFEGLVMSPIVVGQDSGESSGPPDVEKDSSAWKQIVRPEIGGGLLVKARYLRGKTRTREAQVMGLDPSSVTVVCLQFNFENRRSDTGVLRHVRLMQRGGGGGSGTIPPRRVIIPPEISVLKKGEMSSVILGMNFSSASDKDGAFTARFDAKSDKGSNPIEIRVPVGEVLQECLINRADFNKKVDSMKGIHQRVVSSITLSASKGKSVKEIYKDIPELVAKHSKLTAVQNEPGWQSNVCSFAGTLPVSGDVVCVTITCDPAVGSGEIMACSNNAIVSNSILGLLKAAIEK